MFESDLVFSPELLLLMWGAGTAGAGATVAWWRIVGSGYHRLGAAVVVLIGGAAWYFDPHLLTALGVLAGAASLILGARIVAYSACLGATTIFFLVRAVITGSAAGALTGSLALGGVTAGMLLGHWYLVSPQMPRWALRRLNMGAAAGLVLDVLVLTLGVGLEASPILWTAFFVLAGVSILLTLAVWGALGEPSYTGVMAATGLSYLAVLTTLGVVALGRTLAVT